MRIVLEAVLLATALLAESGPAQEPATKETKQTLQTLQTLPPAVREAVNAQSQGPHCAASPKRCRTA